MPHREPARAFEDEAPAERGSGRWRAWLATGTGVRMTSASLTTLERDVVALGWLDGGQFFPPTGPRTGVEDSPPEVPGRLVGLV